MNLQIAQQYWALIAAGVLAFGVFLFVLLRLLQDSARGRLAVAADKLRRKKKAARKAGKQVTRARSKLDRLRARGDSVIPRRAEEAKGRLVDAQALHKIAEDQVLIASNHVRQIIVEEFPPRQHDALRRRLLPQEALDGKPFTMGA